LILGIDGMAKRPKIEVNTEFKPALGSKKPQIPYHP